MILKLVLRHTKTGAIQTQDLWGVDATRITALAQSPKPREFVVGPDGKTKKINRDLEDHITNIVRTKLPPAFYNFDVVEWELQDHRPYEKGSEVASQVA